MHGQGCTVRCSDVPVQTNTGLEIATTPTAVRRELANSNLNIARHAMLSRDGSRFRSDGRKTRSLMRCREVARDGGLRIGYLSKGVFKIAALSCVCSLCVLRWRKGAKEMK